MSAAAVRAISWAEASALGRSWLVRAWLALVAALGLFVIASVAANGERDILPEVLSGWLALYLVPTTIAFGILGAAALSADLDIATDSILVRAVTRYDFVAGKVGSRLLLGLGVHLAVTLPVALLILKVSPQDGNVWQIAIGCLAVGVVLVFLTALATLIGALVGHTLLAIAAFVVIVASQALIFDFLGLDYLSITSFLRDLRFWLQGEAAAWTQARLFLAFGAAAAACVAATAIVFGQRDL